jgi:hypothetical protein
MSIEPWDDLAMPTGYGGRSRPRSAPKPSRTWGKHKANIKAERPSNVSSPLEM